MAFCAKCGAKVEDSDRFCPSCGAAVGAPTEASAAQTQPPQTQPPQAAVGTQTAPQTDFSVAIAGLTDTPDTTAEFDPADIAANKAMALLAYIGILVLIPLLAAKNSKYARFHTNQGLVLLLAEIAFSVVRGIVMAIMGAISSVLSTIFSILFWVVSLLFLVLLILGIVNAVTGKAKELPVIGKLRLIK